MKSGIRNRLTSFHKRCIFALDIKGAFDSVLQSAIVAGLRSHGCGERKYGYVRAFSTNRTAIIGLGYLRSSNFTIKARRIMQGSFISLLLVNIAMKDLLLKLQSIHIINTRHTRMILPSGRLLAALESRKMSCYCHNSLPPETWPPVRFRKIGFADSPLPTFSQICTRHN